MRSLYQFTPVLLITLMAVIVGSCDETRATEDFDVANLTPHEVWARFVAKNYVWLQPTAKNLSYSAHGKAIQTEIAALEISSRVWVSDKQARWQWTVPVQDRSYLLVVNRKYEQLFDNTLRKVVDKPKKARDIRPLVQGIHWKSAVHAIADRGLPEGTSIIDRGEGKDGHIIVLDTYLGVAWLEYGITVEGNNVGWHSSPIEKVRIHVKVPDFIPVREEIPRSGVVIEYESDYLKLADQLAPQTVRFRIDKLSRGMETHFRIVNDLWLLDHAYTIHDGKKIYEMTVSDVSTEPINPELFAMQKP